MNRVQLLVAALVVAGVTGIAVTWWCRASQKEPSQTLEADEGEALWAGSGSCRQCHQEFYQTVVHFVPWPGHAAVHSRTGPGQAGTVSGGHQGGLGPLPGGVDGQCRCRARRGNDGEKTYPIVHVLGGKNVYYLLTPLERGRLQVLPLAYDVRRKEWYDTAASGMRHFGPGTDAPLDWHDPLFTFNTSCYDCHVSQLTRNYDADKDTYHTVWAEPGINCEACHGPSGKHVKTFSQAPPGQPPANLGLISTRKFTPEQHNDACSVCHAKMSWITASYPPGGGATSITTT